MSVHTCTDMYNILSFPLSLFIQGPAGPTGDQGEQGAQGPRGDAGAPGDKGPQGPIVSDHHMCTCTYTGLNEHCNSRNFHSKNVQNFIY